MSAGMGLDHAVKLAMDPEARVTVNPIVFGNTEDEMTFQKIVGVPSIIEVGYFTSTAVAGEVVYSTPVAPTLCYMDDQANPTNSHLQMTPGAMLAMFHRKWRGGHKFCVLLRCAQTVTGRVQIGWVPDFASLSSVSTTTQMGNYISRVVDFRGSTQMTVFIPYLHRLDWLPVIPRNRLQGALAVNSSYNDLVNGYFFMQILNPITNSLSTVTPRVDFIVYASCAEDVVFSDPCGQWDGYTVLQAEESIYIEYDVPAAPADTEPCELQAQWDMHATFSKTFDPILPAKAKIEAGICNGENIAHLRTFFHRYCRWGVGETTNNIGLRWFYDRLDTRPYPHLILLKMYQFARGSVRYLITCDGVSLGNGQLEVRTNTTYHPTNTAGTDLVPVQTDRLVARDIIHTHERTSLMVEIPWNSDRAFATLEPDGIAAIGDNDMITCGFFTITASLTNYGIHIAFGDDFSCGWIRSPPALRYTNPAALTDSIPDDSVARARKMMKSSAIYAASKLAAKAAAASERAPDKDPSKGFVAMRK
jgi:hypothetical protein